MMSEEKNSDVETRPHLPLVLWFAVSLFTVASTFARADDYRLMQLPQLGATSEDDMEIPLAKPQDPAVCQTYLQNLRHFARRNVPMACERPIAPALRDRIRRVEWEDLDPQRYSKLFNALTKDFFGRIPINIPDDTPHELKIKKMFSWVYETPVEPSGPNEYGLRRLREKTLVFRRAKLNLQGYPTHYGVNEAPKPVPEAIHIVQFGNNILDPDYSDSYTKCRPVRGAEGADYYSYVRFYVASADFDDLYGPLSTLERGTSGEYLLLIDGRLYVETMHETAHINLSQININAPVYLEPVCLYEFTKSEPRRK